MWIGVVFNLAAKMSDPVAAKSTFLCMYMSNHPDTLVAYARWFGRVAEVIESAEMRAIDCKASHDVFFVTSPDVLLLSSTCRK